MSAEGSSSLQARGGEQGPGLRRGRAAVLRDSSLHGVALAALLLAGLQPGTLHGQQPAVSQVRLTELATIADGAEAYQLRVHASVKGPDGKPVQKLPAEAFVLELDGVRRAPSRVRTFAQTGEGLVLLLAVDTTRSMTRSLEAVKPGLESMVDRMREVDLMGIAQLGEQYRTVLPFSSDKARLKSAISGLKARDRATGLFEGIYRGTDALWARPAPPRRRVLLLFSDGGNDKAGYTQEQAEQRARTRFVDVHVLHFTAGRSRLSEREEEMAGLLQGLAYKTAGGYYRIARPQEMEQRFQALSEQIYREYVVEYQGDDTGYDGEPHRVGMLVQGLRAIDSLSYDAPSGPPVQPVRLAAQDGGMAAGGVSATAERDEDEEGEGAGLWIPIGLGAGALVVLLLLASDRRRRRRAEVEAARRANLAAGAQDRSKAALEQPAGAGAAAPAPAQGAPAGSGAAGQPHPPTDLAVTPTPEGAGEPRPGVERAPVSAEPGAGEPAGAGAMTGPRLVVEPGGEVFPIDRDRLHIGKHESNQVCLPEERVSGFHASILRRDGRSLLQDRDSTNGTLLNGELVRPWEELPLGAGDLIGIGPYVLRYEE